MSENKKRRKTSGKRSLAAVCLLAAIVLAAVLGGWFLTGGVGRNTSDKTSALQETDIRTVLDGESGTEEATEEASDSETEGMAAAEPQTDPNSEKGSQTETETETETKTETESETETESGEKLVIAIDPGHQGSWVDMSDTEPVGPGAEEQKAKSSTGTEGSYSGLAEYELNLEVSLLLRTELEKRGYETVLTREDNDTAISNAERAQLAYEAGGDIYVRIHANGSEDSSVNGALAMVPSSSNPYVGALAEDSRLLAECILNDYCSRTGFASLGIQYTDNMTGINWSKIPVMILEMGFMTNESDDLAMADPSVQALMAEGIADGIDAYFEQKGLKTKGVSGTETGDMAGSEKTSESMTALMETLGEGYLYPAEDLGEKWAVSVKSLDTGAEGDINGDVPMKSASVIKVFLMAAVYDRILEPDSEGKRIPVQESYEGEIRDLIHSMITVSDNTAANTLLSYLGEGNAYTGLKMVNEYAYQNGYTATSMGRLFLEENPTGDNYTSANDCRALLEAISEGTCVSEEASAEMYAYLSAQTRVSKIPAGLSDTNASVANKTGELYGEYGDYVENDIAIVKAEDAAYLLCVLGEQLQDNASAVDRIAAMSALAYQWIAAPIS